MTQEQETFKGTVENVTFQNEDNGYAVLTLSNDEGELICAVGPLAGSAPGEELTIKGKYINHPKYGVQFEVQACVFRLPETEGAILKYLSSGILPGIGAATAKRIVEKFSDKALEVISNEPKRLAEVQGFSLKKAKKASERFAELFGVREALVALGAFGLTATEALPVYKMYGENTLGVVKGNPYLLCEPPLQIAFTRADAIAQRLEIDLGSELRVQAALQYTLRHNQQNGHTCLPKNRLIETTASFFKINKEKVEEQVSYMIENAQLGEAKLDKRDFIYAADMLRTEMTAAFVLKERLAMPDLQDVNLVKKIETLQKLHGIEYAPQQKQAITQALVKRVMVITGGPGTGKTTTVNAIIELHEQQGDRVLLAAPTGRAAKRMSELAQRPASTIHRLLEVKFIQGSDYPQFLRNQNNPLKCDVIIIDEMSMVDSALFESLLMALKTSCRLIMVGDSDQLPSVGPGNVLKGIIDSGVAPIVALTHIFRQAASSLIVANAHRIVEGLSPQKGTKKDDYFFIQSYGMACQKLVVSLVCERLPQGYNISPVDDIQVLCPGRKGPLGTESLNLRLQEEINPPSEGKAEIRRMGVTFREGDKVMQVRNNYDLPFTKTDGEPGAGVYNGDIGVIEEINISAQSMTIFSEDKHLYYTFENLHEIEHAYAITIHKSQGSEFEAIVLPLNEVSPKLRYRNLLYTGVTRAKRVCVIAGEQEILEEMVRNGRRNLRYSCFAGFLRDKDFV